MDTVAHPVMGMMMAFGRGTTPGPSEISSIAPRLRHKIAYMRQVAAGLLARIAANGHADSMLAVEIIRALTEGVSDSDDLVRVAMIEAVTAVLTFGSHPAQIELSRNKELSIRLVQAVHRTGSQKAAVDAIILCSTFNSDFYSTEGLVEAMRVVVERGPGVEDVAERAASYESMARRDREVALAGDELFRLFVDEDSEDPRP